MTQQHPVQTPLAQITRSDYHRMMAWICHPTNTGPNCICNTHWKEQNIIDEVLGDGFRLLFEQIARIAEEGGFEPRSKWPIPCSDPCGSIHIIRFMIDGMVNDGIIKVTD